MLRALVLVAGSVFAVQAFAVDSYDISCKTQANLPKKAFQANLTLKAEAWLMENKDPKKEQIRLRDITFTAADNVDKGEVHTGRGKTIDAGKNLKARKYKDYYQASMDTLVDTKDFSRFNPIDECLFTVMLPTNLWNKTDFEAPVVTHCDQNGGTQGMDCTLNPHKK